MRNIRAGGVHQKREATRASSCSDLEEIGEQEALHGRCGVAARGCVWECVRFESVEVGSDFVMRQWRGRWLGSAQKG